MKWKLLSIESNRITTCRGNDRYEDFYYDPKEGVFTACKHHGNHEYTMGVTVNVDKDTFVIMDDPVVNLINAAIAFHK